MAKRSDRQRQNSPVSAILYAVAIIALAACIVGLVYYSRTQRKEEAKRLSELAREESLQQEELPDEQTEAESESAAESQKETEPSATESGSSEAVNDTSATESDGNESISEEDTKAAAAVSADAGSTAGTSASGTSNSSDAAESASASISGRTGTSDASVSEPASSDSTTAGNKENQTKKNDWKQDNILVLNGTGTSGVAGYWKGICEDAGCEHVAAATYRGSIEPHTVVYAEEGIDAQGVKDIFPDAEIRTGSVTENIIAADGQNYQIWIVVGKQDARNH